MKKQKEVIQVKEHQREIKKNRKGGKEMTKKNFQKYYKGKCRALTKTGKQCTRDAVGSKYCWQHQVKEKSA